MQEEEQGRKRQEVLVSSVAHCLILLEMIQLRLQASFVYQYRQISKHSHLCSRHWIIWSSHFMSFD